MYLCTKCRVSEVLVASDTSGDDLIVSTQPKLKKRKKKKLLLQDPSSSDDEVILTRNSRKIPQLPITPLTADISNVGSIPMIKESPLSCKASRTLKIPKVAMSDDANSPLAANNKSAIEEFKKKDAVDVTTDKQSDTLEKRDDVSRDVIISKDSILGQFINSLDFCVSTRPITKESLLDGALEIDISVRVSKSNGSEYYALSGVDLLDPSVRKHIPHAFSVDKNGKSKWQKPKWLSWPGTRCYYFAVNTTNKQSLGKWAYLIQDINTKYKKNQLQDVSLPYLHNPDRKDGILGFEVKCILPQWMEELTLQPGKTWNPRFNPVKQGSRFLFNKNSITTKTTLSIFKYLHQRSQESPGGKDWSTLEQVSFYVHHMQKKKWNMYYVGESGSFDDVERMQWQQSTLETKTKLHVITHYSSYAIETWLKTAQETKKKISILDIGWGHHARFAYVDHTTRKIHLFDPWMQNLDKGRMKGSQGFNYLKRVFAKNNYQLNFVQRPAEQAFGEGSCVIMSLVRVLMVSQLGLEGATILPLPYEWIIFTFRLVSMFRN